MAAYSLGGPLSATLIPPRNQMAQHHQAHFRTAAAPAGAPVQGAPQHHHDGVPQTGLGILMNGSSFNSGAATTQPSAPPPAGVTSQHAQPATASFTIHPGAPAQSGVHPPPAVRHITPEQQKMMQQDLLDRERQASALAAAGMVADNVRRSLSSASVSSGHHPLQPPPNGGASPGGVVPPAGMLGGAMPAPPSLGHPPSDPAPQQPGMAEAPVATTVPSDTNNWGMVEIDGGLSAVTIDDMDLDFAKLFDPAQEAANIEGMRQGTATMPGGVWQTAPPAPTLAPAPVASVPSAAQAPAHAPAGGASSPAPLVLPSVSHAVADPSGQGQAVSHAPAGAPEDQAAVTGAT